ncbi:Pls/PosA family non-ribosomal peptide synthetase [Aureimonas sp. D3]|uniref:Pls/PosA family non-ribosomal peptide synthetase n=1 Tax=Aureimonas sp. D3 TaxID=1638164 RepID=UPI0007867496|nr:Pls/PosA family non-ribosomal peptide synthetase [Aureimonas sp. D3]
MLIEHDDAPNGIEARIFAPIAPTPPMRDGEPYARDEMLHEMFEASALAHPGRCALRLLVEDPDTHRRVSLSYSELRDRAIRFAHHLRAMGVKRGDRVVICLPRGLDQYMAILGTLWAGACYVPVDWTYPQDRIDFIADDSRAVLIVTGEERAGDMIRPTLSVDQQLGELAAEPAGPMDRAETDAQPDDLAYIIYTSGTTGRPKGVMISHANACHLVRSESAILALSEEDRVFGGFSLAFDMSVETMWSAFFAGAALYVADELLAKAGPDMANAIEREAITVWHVVPSLLTLVENALPALRIVNLGGEACPPDLVTRWARPGLRLLNTYGPTETTVTATWTEVQPGRKVTIGRPLPGYSAWIVDETLHPVAAGAEGELVIGGPGVGAGYVNRPDLTAEKFVLTPFDTPSGEPTKVYRSGDLVRLDAAGDIEFIGRIDTQVKIRGFRVELGEIEAVIAEDPSVAQAVVHLFKDDDGAEFLAAFAVARTGASIDLNAARARVRDRLPNYMRPAAYQLLDALPTLPASGKVDRKALVRPIAAPAEDHEITPPETEMEHELHAVWSAVLNPQKVSVTDDFFEDLGGHSLKAARLVSAIRKVPGLAGISIQDLYAAPTIRVLAKRLEVMGRGSARAEEQFHPVDKARRRRCAVIQTFALIPIYAIAGLQWFFPYLAYVQLAGDFDRVPALILSGLSFILIPPLALLLSIVVKWVVIGRYKAGDYPLWGSYYLRWWFVRRFSDAMATPYLSGTPIIRAYYRLLGAKIGRHAFIGRANLDAADLIEIGEGAIVSDYALLATSSVERGLLRLGAVRIGREAFVGSMAVIGRGSSVGDRAALEDLSAIPAGVSIPSGECWSGSPAERQGSYEPAPHPAITPRRRFLSYAGLTLAALILPIAALLPIAPGLILLIELDWHTEGYSYLLLSPFLALTYVILMCTLTVAAKRLILPKVVPGSHSIHGWFYLRFWFVQQINDLALQLLHPIYATLYVAPWYRALGVKVGRRAEISTASAIVPDLVEIGPESFIADAVLFGAARIEPGRIRLARTRIGHRSFIGNSALLPTGAQIGDGVLIGVLSKPPADGSAEKPNGTWFGSPSINLPNRQTVALFDEGARFKPGARLVATRLAIEAVRVTLSLTLFLGFFSVLLSVIGDLDDLDNGALWIALSFPFLYIGFVLACGFSVVALKWLVVGRYKPTTRPLWSPFVWRTELVTATYENLAVPNLLEPLRGTPWLPAYLRLLGCRIGRRCYMDTTDITEHDLVEIGDDVALNDFAGLQTHLFEDRVMKVSGVKVGHRATIGSYAIVLYDAEIGEDAQLGDLSVVMKGETLPTGTSWEGSPARLAR